jgi:lipopolysaccharide/colanic/teichoic acid biosynthesis glycosyltransferase
MKRLFDVTVALVGLLLLSPLFGVIAVLIKFDSPGPVFFKQERIGRGFRPFFIYKFRTMVEDAARQGGSITIGNDPRITRFGRFLRKSKLDELPQLFNILRGEMSFVGPRPEVREYVERFRQDYEEILTLRPGVTDLASLKYPDEAQVLARARNPEQEYLETVLPDKINLARQYVARASFIFDLYLIVKTLVKVVGMLAGCQSAYLNPPHARF